MLKHGLYVLHSYWVRAPHTGSTNSTYQLANVHNNQFLLLKCSDFTCTHLIFSIHVTAKRIVRVFIWKNWQKKLFLFMTLESLISVMKINFPMTEKKVIRCVQFIVDSFR